MSVQPMRAGPSSKGNQPSSWMPVMAKAAATVVLVVLAVVLTVFSLM